MEIKIARCLALSVLRRVLRQVALGVREDGSRVRGGASRLSIVNQDTRHASTQHSAMQLAGRPAVARRISSIRPPVFRVRKNVSIFHRRAYHSSLLTASAGVVTGRFVISFQKMGARPSGGSSSSAWTIWSS